MRSLIPTLLLTVVLTSGCVFSHAGPGILYMDVQGPLAMTAAPGQKVGESCAQNYFGLISVGDATIESARQDGGISAIEEVSYDSSNVLGVASFCTVVTGN